MRIKKADSTSVPGGRSDDDKTRLSFFLDTDHLSRADRAAIWRSYTTAVVRLCKNVQELKQLIEDDEFADIVAGLIEDEWAGATNWHDWHRIAKNDLARQLLDDDDPAESG